jgi:hypothetical protein
MLLAHDVEWVTAAPLWQSLRARSEPMRRPALLRFTSDNFMEQALTELGSDPAKLTQRLVTEKKLYQPAHGHFHLVAANLVCHLPGLPDHALDAGQAEQVGFVVRRQSQPGVEFAFVTKNGKPRWENASATLLENEELFSMFPLVFKSGGQRRRLLAGFLPTSLQEQLQSAPFEETNAPPSHSDADLEEIKGRVVEAMKLLQLPPSGDEALEVQASRFILLDLADFLARKFTTLWQAIYAGTAAPQNDGGLVNFLRAHKVESSAGVSFAEALKTAYDDASTIEENAQSLLTCNLRRTPVGFADQLLQKLKSASDAAGSVVLPPVIIDTKSTEYVVRCVYRRPLCRGERLSDASAPFSIAAFFDPEAPARPIRISLPIDASLAGLRKFKKNVTVVLSESLRKKMSDGLQSQDAPGLDCSGFMLSIPIITICALIVLMIFISLLNIVFWWLPFFKLCLPKVEVK